MQLPSEISVVLLHMLNMAQMGLPEEPETIAYQKFQQLVKQLNLDEETSTCAWKSFQIINRNYSLEGDVSHWLACAIFVACRNSKTTTVAQDVVKGNPISLTSLLRSSNLSLAQFFDKIEKWANMAKISEDDPFRKKISKLEENLAVACNTFKEYYPMFEKIFKAPTDMDPIKHRNRKQRHQPCTSANIFEFIWYLFITVKGKHTSCSNDLVASYHFLQACCDLAFRNALAADRRDLLNPDFEGLPHNWSFTGYAPPTDEFPCIINKLSIQNNVVQSTDAFYVKEYTLKGYITRFFEDGILTGDRVNFTGLFDSENFEINHNNIVRVYEQHILNEGDFDEKIFLAEYRRQFLLKQNSLTNGNTVATPVNDTVNVSNSPMTATCSGEVVQRCPATPLTGRRYLAPKENPNHDTSLIISAQNSLSILQNLVNGRGTSPSDFLKNIFETCTTDPTEQISETLDTLGQIFLNNFTQNASEGQIEQDQKKLDLTIKLFYKLLENILQNEKNINQHQDVSGLVVKSIFYECLFACSLVIVLYSYNSQKDYSWVLNTLDVADFYFVRVIELIVRSKDQLSRDAVKYLSSVEESILESRIWRSDSLLWDDISRIQDNIPKFEEIALPGNMVYNSTTGAAVTTPNRKNLFSSNSGQSPGPSAVETFQSPINTHVKKQLFSTVKPGQSLLQSKTLHSHLLTDKDGNKKLIPLDIEQPVQVPAGPGTPTADNKPKKNGSICILLRKFFNLAGVRMDHLCNKLGINDFELKSKIWTVFEHSIRKQTQLIKDRHLDQLLMCAVYVICKITGNDGKNFTDIMKCYREQPQAHSDIYRKVLITRQTEDAPEKKSDLIHFYNNIYVQVMKTFAVSFQKSPTQASADLLLSPLPSVKSLLVSPREQISRNVYITPFSPQNAAKSDKMRYLFNRSASGDLRSINNAIKTGSVPGKRILNDSYNEFEAPSKKFANRKVQALIEERRTQSIID